MTAHNLLAEPLIRYTTADGPQHGSLPEVYAALMADRVGSFPALRAHQEPAWHMFLAQLGAIACHRAELPAPPDDAATWQCIIGKLTRTDFPNDEPWCLVVDDWSQPAFLQPPVPEGVNWTENADSADALDMLSTSKNHDLKKNVSLSTDYDDWLFSLIIQQTFDGSLTNNPASLQLGIARMNSGDGSRPFFGLAPFEHGAGISLGKHLRHDISILGSAYVNQPPMWSIAYPVSPTNTVALTWLPEWSTPDKLALGQLDPLFIEICRVIRFRNVGSMIAAQRAGSMGRRIDARDLKGLTGDPWAPVTRTGDKSSVLTFSYSTVHYAKLCEILFDESKYKHPICMDPIRIDANTQNEFQIVIQGISRKRGHQTEKLTKRIIPLGRLNVRSVLGVWRMQVKDLATEQIGEIKKIDAALRNAIALASAGGERDKIKEENYKRTRHYHDRLDDEADRTFFPALWDRFEAQQQGASEEAIEAERRKFLLPLIDAARALLEEGLADIPCPSIRRPRAQARARAQFKAMIRSEKNGFPGLFTNDETTDATEATDAA